MADKFPRRIAAFAFLTSSPDTGYRAWFFAVRLSGQLIAPVYVGNVLRMPISAFIGQYTAQQASHRHSGRRRERAVRQASLDATLSNEAALRRNGCALRTRLAGRWPRYWRAEPKR
ncbi:hypothetical protein KCP78_06815 [Salmonella enterica subsp. enterica]|nr:hypothetical protein KCP78_06815 [Salmonella enterica subsp. enterica]